jgi:hypothetical protein
MSFSLSLSLFVCVCIYIQNSYDTLISPYYFLSSTGGIKFLWPITSPRHTLILKERVTLPLSMYKIDDGHTDHFSHVVLSLGHY